MRYCAQPGCPVKVERGRCATHALVQARDQWRRADAARTNNATRKLYHSPQWVRLKAYMAAMQPLCVQCEAMGRVTIATDLDHIVPHRGDTRLFFATTNVQRLCAACHTRKTRRGE